MQVHTLQLACCCSRVHHKLSDSWQISLQITLDWLFTAFDTYTPMDVQGMQGIPAIFRQCLYGLAGDAPQPMQTEGLQPFATSRYGTDSGVCQLDTPCEVDHF